MVNVSIVLKDMIRRLARKEIKASTSSIRQAVAQYRRDIAKLKRQVRDQQKEIGFLKAQEQKRLSQRKSKEKPPESVRFSARSVKAQRKRLGLSAADYGKLVGVSGLTIYNWESGKARPRKAQLAALVDVRGMGKREATAKLGMLRVKEERVAKKPRKRGRRKSTRG